MDVNALGLLVEIIDAGNLSRAAARLGMSRANVSHRLSQFERDLGQQLLRRTTRQIEPTELGRRLYEHGRSIRHELLSADESVAALGQALQGRVRLSVPSGYGQLTMAGWLTDFMRSYPGIALEVIFDNAIEDLMDGRVDCAVRVMNDPPEHLVARHLGPVQYVACATPACMAQWGQPQTLQALLRLPLIASGLTEQKLRMAGLQTLGQGDAALSMRLVSPNFYFLREALLQGLGVGLVPDYMVRESIAQGALQALALPAGSLDFLATHKYLLYMPTRFQTRAIQTLTEYLHERALAEAV
ncbi:LysR substrate-binding domain-containing protein [Comamonas terrigena]|jgi:DNA-binding transcriptional LysR family regulator|uniref:LysR family transcriptional regulator n=1 Tax=Comamonas terrigena TaxID=32013 RepID=UPI002448684E|nr:LysR family transcriptional regulator [Comamonas terrigena]MDH1291541.1 LysR substrate-binding domain-containing protein [Comamonas terrigena]